MYTEINIKTQSPKITSFLSFRKLHFPNKQTNEQISLEQHSYTQISLFHNV